MGTVLSKMFHSVLKFNLQCLGLLLNIFGKGFVHFFYTISMELSTKKLFKELILINPFRDQMCFCHMLYLMYVCHDDLIEMH